MDKTKEMMILEAMAKEMNLPEDEMAMKICVDEYTAKNQKDRISENTSSSEIKRIALNIITDQITIYKGGYKIINTQLENLTTIKETDPTLTIPYIKKILDKFC